MRHFLSGLWLAILLLLPFGAAQGNGLSVAGNFEQQPKAPELTGSVSLGGALTSVYASGRYAYVVSAGAVSLMIVDVTDPASPEEVGNLAVGTDTVSVFVAGRYAYTVDVGDNLLRVVDVSDPASPSVVGSLGIGDEPRRVAVSGRYAYVVDSSSNDLKVIDVSNPALPALAGSLGVGDFPRDLSVVGRYAYVTDSSSNDLKVIDLSDPGMPQQVGSLALGAGLKTLDVSGRYAFVADSGTAELRVIDVSDPTTPVEVGGVSISEGGSSGPRAVVASGRYTYIVDSIQSALSVIDVADPTTPIRVESTGLGTFSRGLHVAGRYAYVIDAISEDLKVFDVSGGETSSLIAHSMEAGNLQVRNDIIAQGQLQVSSGVNVGAGGLFSDGDAGFAQNVDIIGDLTVAGSCAGCTSDLRLKQNVQPLVNALERVIALNGVSWDWQEDTREARLYPGPQLGVIGDEVAEAYPELVGADSRGYQFVRYQKLVAPLIEAVKELKAENDELQALNAELLSRLEALEAINE